jgi:hypothetical protein
MDQTIKAHSLGAIEQHEQDPAILTPTLWTKKEFISSLEMYATTSLNIFFQSKM